MKYYWKGLLVSLQDTHVVFIYCWKYKWLVFVCILNHIQDSVWGILENKNVANVYG